MLLAAVLTRFYYTVQVNLVSPIARWDSDVAVLSHKSEAALWYKTASRQADDGTKLIKSLLHDIANRTSTQVDSSVTDAVRLLLDDMKNDLLCGPTLALRRLRFLTEVAWYFVSHDRPIYAGWTDLLLLLHPATRSEGFQQQGPCPPFPEPQVIAQHGQAIT